MAFRNALWASIPLALCITGCQDRNAADIPEVIHDWPQTERLPDGSLNYVGLDSRPRFTRKGEGLFSTIDGDIVLSASEACVPQSFCRTLPDAPAATRFPDTPVTLDRTTWQMIDRPTASQPIYQITAPRGQDPDNVPWRILFVSDDPNGEIGRIWVLLGYTKPHVSAPQLLANGVRRNEVRVVTGWENAAATRDGPSRFVITPVKGKPIYFTRSGIDRVRRQDLVYRQTVPGSAPALFDWINQLKTKCDSTPFEVPSQWSKTYGRLCRWS